MLYLANKMTAGIGGAHASALPKAMEPKGGSRNEVSSDPGKPLKLWQDVCKEDLSIAK